jgi:monoamine oxidase
VLDVLIIGAGLSGIGAARHLQNKCPEKTWRIWEARAQMGGTWDLFRYPGVRSDSDMLTLGYAFKPWVGTQTMADGSSILNYIRDAAHETVLPAQRLLAVGVEGHHRVGQRAEPGRARQSQGVQEHHVALAGAVELGHPAHAKALLELMPDIRPQAVTHHGAKGVAVIVRLAGRVQQVAAQLADIDETGGAMLAHLAEKVAGGKFAPYQHRGA